MLYLYNSTTYYDSLDLVVLPKPKILVSGFGNSAAPDESKVMRPPKNAGLFYLIAFFPPIRGDFIAFLTYNFFVKFSGEVGLKLD